MWHDERSVLEKSFLLETKLLKRNVLKRLLTTIISSGLLKPNLLTSSCSSFGNDWTPTWDCTSNHCVFHSIAETAPRATMANSTSISKSRSLTKCAGGFEIFRDFLKPFPTHNARSEIMAREGVNSQK